LPHVVAAQLDLLRRVADLPQQSLDVDVLGRLVQVESLVVWDVETGPAAMVLVLDRTRSADGRASGERSDRTAQDGSADAASGGSVL
jgi:hypothetical protein